MPTILHSLHIPILQMGSGIINQPLHLFGQWTNYCEVLMIRFEECCLTVMPFNQYLISLNVIKGFVVSLVFRFMKKIQKYSENLKTQTNINCNKWDKAVTQSVHLIEITTATNVVHWDLLHNCIITYTVAEVCNFNAVTCRRTCNLWLW